MKRPLTGLRAWLVQRVSALYLLAFLLFLVARMATAALPWTYGAWRAWVLAPAVSVAVLLFFAALLLHAWVGMRDVILDYIHPVALRIGLLGCFAIGEIGVGAWVLVILFHR